MWIALAFAVVALVFVAASALTEHVARDIGVEALALKTNALPSVQHLTVARTELRHAWMAADAAVHTPAIATERLEALRRARKALGDELGTYHELPGYPGEHELYDREVRPELDRLDGALAHLIGLVSSGRYDSASLIASQDVKPAVEDLEASLKKLDQLNAEQAASSAASILRIRDESARLMLAADVVSFAISVVAATLAIGAARRYTRAVQRTADLQSARASELDAFALRVAHDLLSPLSAVALSLGSIERRHHQDVETERAVARANRALWRSRELAHGVYRFASSGALPAPGAHAPLSATIRSTVDDLLAVESDSPPELFVEPFADCEVACDTAVLSSMLSNLLDNAAKFTKGSPVRRITVRAKTGERRVRIEVEDTGPGVPVGFESAVFDPYFRVPGVTEPGLGLGLATVKRYAKAHGGAVGMRRLEAGTVFWFELPRAPMRPSVAAERPPEPSPQPDAAPRT